MTCTWQPQTSPPRLYYITLSLHDIKCDIINATKHNAFNSPIHNNINPGYNTLKKIEQLCTSQCCL